MREGSLVHFVTLCVKGEHLHDGHARAMWACMVARRLRRLETVVELYT